jgi:HEAT repeat protein
MRRGDTRVTRAAIAALAGIDDAAAGQALQQALEAATDENRAAILDAVVSTGDRRAVPLLCRMLEGADPFGAAHPVVLALVKALGRLKDDRAVPALTATLLRRKRFARARQRALKTGAIQALRALGTPDALEGLAQAAKADRLVRKLAEVRP